MLTESVLLSLVAGVVGVLTAEGCLRFLLRFVPFNIPRENEISIDWVVLGFAVLISFVTGLVFGLAPAIQSTKANLIGALREGARGSGYSTKTHRLRGLLIVSELAFTVVLMIGAGLLMRTFWRLLQEDRGFNSTNVVVSNTRFPVPNDPKLDPYFDISHTTPFIREVLRRGSAIPGVELAAVTSDLPATPVADIRGTHLTIEDLPPDASSKLAAKVIQVSPDYFRVIQTSLVRGRFFSESDEADKLIVAIIDETTARRYWPGRDAIGRRLKFGQECSQVTNAEQLAGCVSNQPWVTVVGIVRDIKYADLDIGVPHIYTSIYQRRSRTLSLVLRTPLAPALLEPQIRSAVQAVDPNLPVFGVRSLNVVTEGSMAPQRFSAELVGSFAMMALLLASVGIYGLLAYLVGQRSQEIGVRIALGAQRRDILRLILTQGALLAGVGVCVGLILAALAAPMIAALLYGIRAIDPLVFLAVPLILLGVSFAASYIPARRAAKISPIVALREG
jgi:putative ABC transport system permease protein